MAKRQSFLPGYGYIVEEDGEESFLPGYGYVKEDQVTVVSFIPYPNPRYVLAGGMQPMQGGV